MQDNNDSIKQENEKAMPKFIALIVVSGLVGGVLGALMIVALITDFADVLNAAGMFFATKVAVWLLIALPMVELAVCLPVYFGAKKRMAGWDGEDEIVSREVETKLSVCLLIISTAFILSFFLLAALFSGFVEDEAGNLMVAIPLFFGGLAAFGACLMVSMGVQQKVVDTAKTLNPEKRGSVYDIKFQKKWMESCDEAERAIIGQCAVKAYQAMCLVCQLLWVVFAMGGMAFNWGFLPAMAVCIVWAAGQAVYFYWGMKLDKPGQML